MYNYNDRWDREKDISSLRVITLKEEKPELLMETNFYHSGSIHYSAQHETLIYSTKRESIELENRSSKAQYSFRLVNLKTGKFKRMGKYENCRLSPNGEYAIFTNSVYPETLTFDLQNQKSKKYKNIDFYAHSHYPYPIFSPNDDFLVYCPNKIKRGEEITLSLVNLKSKETLSLSNLYSSEKEFCYFSPDGKHLVFYDNARKHKEFRFRYFGKAMDLNLLRLDDLELQHFPDAAISDGAKTTFSPNMSYFLTSIYRNQGSDTTDLLLLNLIDKTSKRYSKIESAKFSSNSNWLAVESITDDYRKNGLSLINLASLETILKDTIAENKKYKFSLDSKYFKYTAATVKKLSRSPYEIKLVDLQKDKTTRFLTENSSDVDFYDGYICVPGIRSIKLFNLDTKEEQSHSYGTNGIIQSISKRYFYLENFNYDYKTEISSTEGRIIDSDGIPKYDFEDVKQAKWGRRKNN
ncbi:MAG: hypothetical protein AAF806_27350 [Bacteroidota bacterium]